MQVNRIYRFCPLEKEMIQKKMIYSIFFVFITLSLLTGFSDVVHGETERIVLDPPPTLVGSGDLIECPTCGEIIGTQSHYWKVTGDGTNPHTPDGYDYIYDYTIRDVYPCPNCSKTQSVEDAENAPASPPVVQVNDDAPQGTSGEETTSVKTAAILGIAATMAAIAGAGVAAGGAAGAAGGASGGTSGAAGTADPAGQKAAEEGARQKTGDFRMVLYKSFGDTIFHGETNQYIMARIEQKNEATALWELDLTRSNAISITLSPVEGFGLYPPPPNPAAPGKGNTIMLKNEKPKATEATLSLKFSAPDGGYFEHNMRFKLSAVAQVVFF